jgi:Family of unknown function (DUF6114)
VTSNGARDSEPGNPDASDEYDAIEELGPVRQALLAWQRWRRTRPFWGGLLIILGGAEMLISEQAPLPIIIHVGIQGLAGYLVPIVLVLCGVLLWLTPLQQTFYSVLAVLLALGSWITSNLGGFFIGLMLGVIGGALGFAWQRGEDAGPSSPDALSRPGKTPSEGLSLILGDEAAGEATDDGEPVPDDSSPQAGGDEAGESGRTGTVIMAMSAIPVLLAVLSQAASPSPSLAPSPSATPSGSPSPSAVPSLSPTPTTSPSPTGMPTGSVSPGPPRHGTEPATAADAVSSITATSAVLTGLSFDGVASVRTTSGLVSMLMFTMSSMTLTGGTLQGGEAGGRSLGTASSLLGLTGHVLLYTTKLTGEVQGVAVTYTPESPPLKISSDTTLTDMVIDQPYASADTLQVSAFQQTVAAG